MDIQFGNLAQLNWFWLVLIVAVVLATATVFRRRAINKFATNNLLSRLFPRSMSHRLLVKSLVTLTVMSLLIIGLIDVRWGKSWREVPQKGIDVVFALDVSRSMLAADVSPNRLERAKQQIKDMVDEMAGDRVGLVVFAGESRMQVPLTRHYHDFKNALDEVGPYHVSRGGSELAEAIKLSADAFLDKTGDHQAIVIFTDGENQEIDPVDIARELYEEEGIRIFTVGIGDSQQGALVPAAENSRQQFMTYDGQQVRSKLNGAVLEQVAVAAGGAYIPAETKHVDMGDVYHGYIANVEQQDFETARIRSYIPRYQIFVGLALALTLLEFFWPQRRSRSDLRMTEALFGGKRHVASDAKPGATKRQPENNQQGVAA